MTRFTDLDWCLADPSATVRYIFCPECGTTVYEDEELCKFCGWRVPPRDKGGVKEAAQRSVDCPVCHGDGCLDGDDGGPTICPRCEGTGEVEDGLDWRLASPEATVRYAFCPECGMTVYENEARCVECGWRVPSGSEVK